MFIFANNAGRFFEETGGGGLSDADRFDMGGRARGDEKQTLPSPCYPSLRSNLIAPVMSLGDYPHPAGTVRQPTYSNIL
jgi:hypothetical protein